MFLDVLMNALSVRNDDSRCLFTLSLLLAMIQNEGACSNNLVLWTNFHCCLHNLGVHPKLLEAFSLKPLPPVSNTHLSSGDTFRIMFHNECAVHHCTVYTGSY